MDPHELPDDNAKRVLGLFSAGDDNVEPLFDHEPDEVQPGTPEQQRIADEAVAAQMDKMRKEAAYPTRRRAGAQLPTVAAGFVGVPVPFKKHVRYFHETATDRLTPAFEDRDRHVVVIELSEQAILGAMQVAHAKWGPFRVTGDEKFRRACAEIAAKHGIALLNPDLQPPATAARTAPSTGTAATAAPVARPTPSATQPATQTKPIEPPVAAPVPDGISDAVAIARDATARSQIFLRDLLVDAGFNLQQLSLTWPRDQPRTLAIAGELDAPALDTVIDACRRAGVLTVLCDDALIDVADASAGRAALHEAARQAMLPDAPVSAAYATGYAFARYQSDLSIPRGRADAQLLLPKALRDHPFDGSALHAFGDGCGGGEAHDASDLDASANDAPVHSAPRFGP